MSTVSQLSVICGREITSIHVEEHVLGETRSLIALCLDIDKCDLQITMKTAQNGWGLAVTNEPRQAVDLEQYGRIEVTDARGRQGLAAGVVQSVWAMLSPESTVPVGISWQVDDMAPVVVYSYDDELLVGATPCSEIGAVTYERLCLP